MQFIFKFRYSEALTSFPVTVKHEANCYPSLPHNCSYMGPIKVWGWQKLVCFYEPAVWSSRQKTADLQANSSQTCQSRDPGLFGLARVQLGRQSFLLKLTDTWRWMLFYPQLNSQMWICRLSAHTHMTAVPSVTTQVICTYQRCDLAVNYSCFNTAIIQT